MQVEMTDFKKNGAIFQSPAQHCLWVSSIRVVFAIEPSWVIGCSELEAFVAEHLFEFTIVRLFGPFSPV